jgi:tRNA pseudouridine32 synthase/23S rRNA pseudouridine746 synthase
MVLKTDKQALLLFFFISLHIVITESFLLPSQSLTLRPHALHLVQKLQEDNYSLEKHTVIDSNISIPILYESDNVIIINKPPHVPHHDSETEIGILSHVRILQSKEEGDNQFTYKGRIYGVHRLDRVTSGILILAKTKEAAASLSNSFRNKDNMTKYYIALTNKKPKKKKQGWVKGDMTPSRRGSWKLTSTKDNPAITRFFSAGLGNFKMDNWPLVTEEKDASLFLPKTMILFQPHTGQTHQLRVAAKSLGLPILGDERYADAIDAQIHERTYLHALAMHVDVNGEDVTVWNPPDWFHSMEDDQSGNSAEGVLLKLIKKNCENKFILQAVSEYYRNKAI